MPGQPARHAGGQADHRAGRLRDGTKDLVGYARQCGVAVSVSLPIGRQPRVQAAIRALHTDQPDVWQPAVRQDRSVREGAHVAELADPPLADGWPDGMRIIVRREPLHDGAQQTIDDIDGHRFTATLTDIADTDIVAIDRHHRARARIEDRIKDAKDCGLDRLLELAKPWETAVVVYRAVTLRLHQELHDVTNEIILLDSEIDARWNPLGLRTRYTSLDRPTPSAEAARITEAQSPGAEDSLTIVVGRPR